MFCLLTKIFSNHNQIQRRNKECFSLHSELYQWKQLPELKVGVSYATLVAFKDVLIVIGGYSEIKNGTAIAAIQVSNLIIFFKNYTICSILNNIVFTQSIAMEWRIFGYKHFFKKSLWQYLWPPLVPAELKKKTRFVTSRFPRWYHVKS